jgi:rhodanese-related sulfurtransferase
MNQIKRRVRYLLRTNPVVLAALACAALLSTPSSTTAQEGAVSANIDDIPKEKQTTLGLYMTAKDAYDEWRTDPDLIKLLDVRTPEEYIFVGHAMMAVNIPLLFQGYEWDASGTQLTLKSNPDFVTEVKKWAQPGDRILVMCRSGGRSARAINKLAEAGFTNAVNITDGMEGDTVTNQASPDYGKRKLNGWKNANLPWSYSVDKDHMRLPAGR